MNADQRPLAGRRIGVFGKGGSGKSTTTILLAGVLRDRGYEVCVLDADSTNEGLHRALGLDSAPAQLLDHFGGMIFSGGRVTCPVDDPTPLAGAEISVGQLPHQHYSRNDRGVLLLTAGKIGDQGPGAGCDGPISKIARDLKITQDGEAFVTLIDFKAGFEDSARGAVTSLDWALVVVDPTAAAIRMAVDMRNMVKRIKAGELPATKHLESPTLVAWAERIFRQATIKDVWVVLNRIEDEETERYLRKRLGEQGIEPVGVIHEDRSITMAWLKGRPLEPEHTRPDVERIVENLILRAREMPAVDLTQSDERRG